MNTTLTNAPVEVRSVGSTLYTFLIIFHTNYSSRLSFRVATIAARPPSLLIERLCQVRLSTPATRAGESISGTIFDVVRSPVAEQLPKGQGQNSHEDMSHMMTLPNSVVPQWKRRSALSLLQPPSS